MIRRVALVAAAAWPVLLPVAADACSMCLANQGGGTTRAFAIGSIFLSVMPLAVIGGAVWYLRRRARALAAERAETAPASPAH